MTPALNAVSKVRFEETVLVLTVKDGCEKTQVAATGRFPQLKLTEPLKPPEGATETVRLVDWPETTLALDGAMESVKAGACVLRADEDAVAKLASPL